MIARVGNGGLLTTPDQSIANVYRVSVSEERDLLGTMSIPSLGAGEYVDLELSDISGLITGDRIEVIVDEIDVLCECLEDNNAHSIPAILVDSVSFSGTVRDFLDTHPDFEQNLVSQLETGIVASQLGSDLKPQYVSSSSTASTNGAQSFNQWFNDIEGVNQSRPFSLELSYDSTTGLFQYRNDSFYPIDDELFGNQGRAHNQHFTYELNSRFTYLGGETLRVRSDDDAWVFINGRLAIDLGGTHTALEQSISLADLATILGLTIGNNYRIDAFFTDRQSPDSVLEIDTSLQLGVAPQLGVDTNLAVVKNPITLAESADIQYSVINTGNVPQTLTARVSLVDNLGNTIEQFAPRVFSMLPSAGQQAVDLSWSPSQNHIGVYTVILEVIDEQGTVVSNASSTLEVVTDGVITLAASAMSPVYYVNQAVGVNVSASHSKDEVVQYELVNAPPTASIDSSTGQLVWIASSSDLGTNTFFVRASSTDGAEAQKEVTVRIEPIPNQAPNIVSIPDSNVTVETLYRYQVVATDGNGDVLTYRLDAAPVGMTINPTTGEVLWTPLTDQLGRADVILVVDDGREATARQSFPILVSDAPTDNVGPQIVSTPSTSINAGGAYLYQVVATDADGDNLNYSLVTAPNGMTIDAVSGLAQWQPSESDVGEQNITVRVLDPLGAFVEQSYTLQVFESSQRNTPPTVLSTPGANAVIDQLYSYQVQAVDADGDPLTYVLETAPIGILIDPNSGLLTWIPTAAQAGSVDVVIAISDDRGGLALQSYALIASEGTSANQLPVINSTPGYVAKSTRPYQYQLIANDPDNDLLDYQLLTAPAGMTITSFGQLDWIPGSEQQATVRVRVSDGFAYVEQGWTITVLSSDVALAADLTVSPQFVDEGESVEIRVTPINAVDPVQISVLVDGESVTLDSTNAASVTAIDVGAHSVQATISDRFETVTISDEFSVRDPSDTEAPEVTLLTPFDGDLVTAPIDIIGAVSDDNLQSWRLIYKERAAASDEFVVMAEGTTSFESQSLASFDPTMLRNGQYRFALFATDSNGQTSQANATVLVDSDLKVGNFSITFEDVNVPLVGVPISVKRTYDSRDKSKIGDFGYGWSLDYNNIKVEESRTPGLGWERVSTGGLVPNLCIEPLGAPIVSVTLPDGDVESFEVSVSPRCTQVYVQNNVKLQFTAVGDTQSTLKATDNSAYFYAGNLLADIIDVGTENYADPKAYVLTTRSGYVYNLNQELGIQSVIDPNGQTLTYSDDGIVHSSGKAVDFVRNDQGQVTQIIDPAGNALNYQYTDNVDLSTATDRVGAQTSFTYNSSHGLVDMVDPLGRRVVKNIYDDSGRLIAQEDNEGNRTNFDHDVEGRQSIVTDRNGNVTQLFYDDNGYVTTQIDALGNQTTYTHDANGNELSITDALGQTRFATYTEANDQLTQTDELGNVTQFAYDAGGRETQITDARGNVFNNTYDAVGNLLSVTDPLGNVASNVVSVQGLPTSTTDVLGNVTTYTYDTQGNKLTEIDAEGNLMSYTYDDNNNAITETSTRLVNGEMLEETTSYVYDALNRVVQITNALGQVSRTEFDLAGNEVAQVDALGRRTEMTYDAYGRLLTTLYPDNTLSRQSYYPEGNLLSQTDRLGRVTSYVYDALNRVIQTTQADGSVSTTEYDAIGRVAAQVDANGNRTVYTYDAAGRRTGSTDALGNLTTFEYDADGNQLAMTDANGNRTQFTYNSIDQRTQTTYQDSTTMLDGLDALGRRTSLTDQAGISTSYQYDRLGRLTKVTDALGGETLFTYDSVGNKLTQTDSQGRTTSWTYDALGRVLTRTLPLGQSESMQYDAVGNVVQHIDFNGQVATMQYDINNRLVQANYEGGLSESYEYDAVGSRIEAQKTENGSTTIWRYAYDVLNRLVSETQFADTADQVTLSYEYDAQGNRVTLTETTADSVRITRYTFDALNRLATVKDPLGNTTSYTYDAAGNRVGMSHQNGIQTGYVYDELNRLTQLKVQDSNEVVLKQFDYTLLPNGKRAKIEESNGRVSDFTYDALYRLTQESVFDPVNANHNAQYTYDSVGNRIYEIVNGVSTSYAYNANDWLLQSGGSTFEYDNNGNTLTESLDGNVTTYTYNAKNEMVSLSKDGSTQVYLYNTDGIRLGQANALEQTLYTVDANRDYAQVITELINGTEAVTYTYGDDLISQVRNAQLSNYHYDGLGSTRALSDSEGSITDTYDYDAFGETINQSGATENSYLYTGEQYDPNLDQYYLRARYYNQNVGRFTQMDTWMGVNSDPVSLHKYLYAHADPVNFVDPTGHFISLSGFGSTIGNLARLSTTAVASFSKSFVGRAIAATFVASKTVGSALKREVKTCQKTKGKKCKIPNLVVFGSDFPESSAHIDDAIAGRGSNGIPISPQVTYRKGRKEWNYRTRPPCKGKTGGTTGKDCDEFPFNTTKEGGKTRYDSGQVSLRPISSNDNQGSGRRIWGGATRQAKTGDKFIIVPFSSVPSFYFVNGRYGVK